MSSDVEERVPVPREIYEKALEQRLPEKLDNEIMVDRRGYAPAVADELGQHYMDGEVIFASQNQLTDDVPVLREDIDVVNKVLDSIDGRQEQQLEKLLDTGPVVASITIKHPNGVTKVRPKFSRFSCLLRVDWDRTPEHVRETAATRHAIRRLDREDLADSTYLDEVEGAVERHDAVSEMEPLRNQRDRPISDLVTHLVHGVTIDECRYDLSDGSGYLLKYDNRHGLITEGKAPDEIFEYEDRSVSSDNRFGKDIFTPIDQYSPKEVGERFGNSRYREDIEEQVSHASDRLLPFIG